MAGVTIECFVDEAAGPEAMEIDQRVRQALNDDPALRLEDLPKAELDRLRLHFIGWAHVIENIPSVVALLKKIRPAQLIEEFRTVHHTQSEVLSIFYEFNMLVRGCRLMERVRGDKNSTAIPLTEEVIEKYIKQGLIAELFFSFQGLTNIPIFKPMDLTADDLSKATLRTERPKIEHPKPVLKTREQWYMHTSPARAKKIMLRHLIAEGKMQARREQKMVSDISIAAANELSQTSGCVRIAILYGLHHEPIVDPFRTIGVRSKIYRFALDGGPTRGVIDAPSEVAIRQATDTGKVDDRVVDDIILAELIESMLSAANVASVNKIILDNRLTTTLTCSQFVIRRLTEKQKHALLNIWTAACEDFAKNSEANHFHDLSVRVNILVNRIVKQYSPALKPRTRRSVARQS